MKRKTLTFYAALLVMLLMTSYASAQISPKSTYDLKTYYKNNIAKLDPIEGIYDVNVEHWGENAFRRFSSNTTNLTLYVYRDLSGNFKIFDNNQFTIKKIGNTSVYNFNTFWKGSNITDSKRFVLNDNTYFEVKLSIPDKQLRYDMGRNYQAGFKVNYIYTFVKTYPTSDMYFSNNNTEPNDTQSKDWSGTGFALHDGYVITNYHVMDGATNIHIQGIGGDFKTKYKASVVASDKHNDIALLKTEALSVDKHIPYAIKTTTSDVGEDVFVLGFPLTSTMGEEIKLTTGVISSKTGFQGDVSLYQISAPIQPGNSGGPLFDDKGNVIGIVSAKHKGAENVGYAIKASYMLNLIESVMSKNILPQHNSISTQKLSEKVKVVKNYVYYITCSK